MKQHTPEHIFFNEHVVLAKSGESKRWPSDDKAVIWAADEIERLRAQVQQLQQQLSKAQS